MGTKKDNSLSDSAANNGSFGRRGLVFSAIGISVVVILNFYLRFSWIHAIDPRLYPPTVGIGNEEYLGWDGVRYDWIAKNLLDGKGYGYEPDAPDAWRPPGYPFFLYAVYRIFGHNYEA